MLRRHQSGQRETSNRYIQAYLQRPKAYREGFNICNSAYFTKARKTAGDTHAGRVSTPASRRSAKNNKTQNTKHEGRVSTPASRRSSRGCQKQQNTYMWVCEDKTYKKHITWPASRRLPEGIKHSKTKKNGKGFPTCKSAFIMSA